MNPFKTEVYFKNKQVPKKRLNIQQKTHFLLLDRWLSQGKLQVQLISLNVLKHAKSGICTQTKQYSKGSVWEKHRMTGRSEPKSIHRLALHGNEVTRNLWKYYMWVINKLQLVTLGDRL